MARSRNIKPSFFTNDLLAENDPLGRLLFVGLWTIADCNGNLEWRPRRVKAQILPYDDCDVESLAINLDKSGFIRFYSVGGLTYINIPTFSDHQNPHKNEREKGSETPDYSDGARQAVDIKGLTINRDKSRVESECSDTNRADSLLLIPDSLNPIPDSLGHDSGESCAGKPAPRKKATQIPDDFEPTEKNKELAESLGVSLADELPQFVDHHTARGSTMKSWPAALNTWIRNAKKFGGGKVAAKPAHTGFADKTYTSHTPDWAKED